jgi:hypothetical protein
MSNKLKLKHQLFIGKLIDKYGAFPIKLILKEAYKAIDEIHPKKPYEVLFEIYDKKMKTTVMASTPEEAKDIIQDKIRFYSVKPVEDDKTIDDIFNEIINS